MYGDEVYGMAWDSVYSVYSDAGRTSQESSVAVVVGWRVLLQRCSILFSDSSSSSDPATAGTRSRSWCC